MKKLFLLFIPLLFVLVSSCRKDDDNKPLSSNNSNNQTTNSSGSTSNTNASAFFSVRDQLGNIVTSASIKLYRTVSDLNNQTNQIGTTVFSNSAGEAEINGLETEKYYFRIEKDCQNNLNGGVTTVDNLSKGINHLTIVLNGSGTVVFKCTSSNPYQMYIDGKYVGDVAGKSSKEFKDIPIGTHTFEVIQKSGYVLYPTKANWTETVQCGSNLLLQFP